MLNREKKRFRLRIIVPAYAAYNIYSYVAYKMTALGPLCVASAANRRARWDVEVIDENNLRRYGPVSPSGGADHEYLQRIRPADVVGFYGGLTSTIPRVYRLARWYRAQGAVTVAGGQHFTPDNVPEALASGIDYVVRGEGEETIGELLEAFEGGRAVREVKGIAYLQEGKAFSTPPRESRTDLDRMPFPDFSLVRYAKIDIFPVEMNRYCGMNCEFCAVKGTPSHASPERFLENVRRLLETWDGREFFIVDDLFGQRREDTLRLCRMLEGYQRSTGRRLGFTVQIRLDRARDTELLAAMRRAGVLMVAIGLESPIDEELKAMNKRLDSGSMLAHLKTFRDLGFLVHGMFIFGYPLSQGGDFRMHARERVRRFRSFIKKARIDTVQVMLPVPLPGTLLRQRLERENRVYPPGQISWEYYDGTFPLFEPDPPLSAEEMRSAIQEIMAKFYRFRNLFKIVLSVLSFPATLVTGWMRWYRTWRNSIVRFGGWMLLRKWVACFKEDAFIRKLQQARECLRARRESAGRPPAVRAEPRDTVQRQA